MISFDKKLLNLTVSDKQSKFIHGEERPLLVLVTYWQLTLSVLLGKWLVEAFHFPFRTPLFPSPSLAPSTKATLRFDHISNRDLGLGNEHKSFVDYMFRALCVHNFFICPRSFINSSDSIERKVLKAFLGLIRRLHYYMLRLNNSDDVFYARTHVKITRQWKSTLRDEYF